MLKEMVQVTVWSVVFVAVAALAFAVLPAFLANPCTIALITLSLHELAGRPVSFLRLSVLRMALMRRNQGQWQVGDGREQACLQYVQRKALKGNADAVLSAIDEFAYQKSFLMNVGDTKGKILDDFVRQRQPKISIELGSYIGYSAIRIAKLLPQDGHLYCVELLESNSKIIREMVEHAGLTSKVTVVNGSLSDEGKTISRLIEEYGFRPGVVDLCFIDHDKRYYLSDLKLMMEQQWFREGSVVVADNVLYPGAPEYEKYMKSDEAKAFWMSREFETYLEYQTIIKDKVLVSTYIKKND